MIESMRAFGYSPQAAIADLLDNSISAGAANIWVEFFWSGSDSYVAVTDDGHGMSEHDLSDAMRLGSSNPLDPRDPSDLGRFGLGLKTASFSQARRITVASKQEGAGPAIRQWDLDYVHDCGDWRLLTTAASGTMGRTAPLKHVEHGTTVLWEQMDRVVDSTSVDDKRAKRHFLEMTRTVEHHIAMVFHRFLGPPRRLAVWINGERVQPWDPFMSDHPATQRRPKETLPLHGQSVVVQPFVLPHHSRLTVEEHKDGAGVAGWNAQQGFYIYRNRRLLVAGDWLRLGFQNDEHCKLARIQIDLPNSLDGDWSIDVKKATARPPSVLREDLRRIAKLTRGLASDIYRHRGKVIARSASQDYAFVWSRAVKNGKTFYRISRDHPLVRTARVEAGEGADALEAVLRLVEETVPTPLMVLDQSEKPEEQATPFEGAKARELIAVLERVYASLRSDGMSDQDARQRILTMEPFHLFPDIVASYDGEMP